MTENDKPADGVEHTVWVIVPPRREGVWRQPPVVAASREEAVHEAAEAYDLPVSATNLAKWESVSHWSSELQQYRYESRRIDGKYYLGERRVAFRDTESTGVERGWSGW